MNFLSTTQNVNPAADTAFIVLMAVFCVAVMAVAVWLLTKYIKKPKYAESYSKRLLVYDKLPEEKKATSIRPVKFNFLGIWFAIAGIGLAIRLIPMFFVSGYRPTNNQIIDDLFIAPSLPGLYGQGGSAGIYGAHLYPIPAYIFSFFGLFARAFRLESDPFAMSILIRIPLILADIGLMLVVYRVAKRHLNEYCALILSGFVALFPPFIILSSVWGSVYSLAIVLIVLSMYFMANKKMLRLFLTYSLALLTSRAALYLFPVVAVFVLYQFIKAVKHNRRSAEKKGFREKLKDPDAKNAILVPIYIIGFWLASWLISLPLIHQYSFNPFNFVFMIYLYPLASHSHFGFNALNIFNLFVGVSGNGAVWGASTGMSVMFAVLFGAIITGLVLLVYVSRKNRALLVFLAGFVYLTLSIFFIDFGAANLIVVIALFLLAFMLIRDKRLLMLVGLLGLILTLNLSFVLVNANFLNTLGDTYLNLGYQYLLLGGAGYHMNSWLAANIVLSALTIIVFIYATVVMLDIAMSNKRKLFVDLEKPTFLKSIGKFIRNK